MLRSTSPVSSVGGKWRSSISSFGSSAIPRLYPIEYTNPPDATDPALHAHHRLPRHALSRVAVPVAQPADVEGPVAEGGAWHPHRPGNHRARDRQSGGPSR